MGWLKKEKKSWQTLKDIKNSGEKTPSNMHWKQKMYNKLNEKQMGQNKSEYLW